MNFPSLTNVYRIYRVGKMAYVIYSGIPAWGWAAYEVYSLSKNMYFTTPKEVRIIQLSETCGCKGGCECDSFTIIT